MTANDSIYGSETRLNLRVQAPLSRAAARRARILSRLLPLLALAALVFAGVRALGWLSGGRSRSAASRGGVRAAASDATGAGPPTPQVDLAACMAEPNATAGRLMTTDLYLSGEPTRLAGL